MSYLNMATNRLKTFQTDSYDLNRGKDLLNLCLAYDWVKPSLSSSDDALSATDWRGWQTQYTTTSQYTTTANWTL